MITIGNGRIIVYIAIRSAHSIEFSGGFKHVPVVSRVRNDQ